MRDVVRLRLNQSRLLVTLSLVSGHMMRPITGMKLLVDMTWYQVVMNTFMRLESVGFVEHLNL